MAAGPSHRGIETYPLLKFKDENWAATATEALAALAAEHREELNRCLAAGEFPREIFAEMGRRRWAGSLIPTEYGGLGGSVAEYSLIGEEVGRHGLVSVQTSVQGALWLLSWGTEEQKANYLPAMASGELVFAEAISEPGVGSSLKLMQATARRSGSDWVLNGRKTHVNLGHHCDLMIVYAMVPDAGLSAFLVEVPADGLVTRKTDPVGLRLIPTADVELVDVKVPEEALLGGPGQGMDTFFSTFNVSRIGNASELIGFGRRALAEAIEYARKRQVGNSVVTDFQGIQWTIADAYAGLHSAALARDHAAIRASEGLDASFETSLAKRIAIDAAEYAANESFALTGGFGLYNGQPYIGLLSDVKVLRIAGGSLEVLRNYVARRVLNDEELRDL